MKRLFAITGVMLLLMAAATAFAECPPAEFVCEYWPPFIECEEGIPCDPGTPTHWCSGFDCFEMNYAEEAKLVAVDDEGDYPNTWHFWVTGEVTSVSCEYLVFMKGKGNVGHLRINMPDQLHCATKLETDEHTYLWFFASNPEVPCMGWVECQVD